MNGKRSEYYFRRASGGCRGCGSYSALVDPISALCPKCKSHLRCHGSTKIKKPRLKFEIESARMRVAYATMIADAENVFNRFMHSYATPSGQDKLRRLCWLHFVELRTCDGEPLMTFRDAIVQTLAVNIYESKGGRIDEQKSQYNYLMGRASICPWNRSKQTAQGVAYDYKERRYLQSNITLMHRAYKEIFLKAGIARFISKVNNEINRRKERWEK